MADGFKACSINGCNGNAHYSANGKCGYCGKHYYRMRTHGDALGGRTPDGEAIHYLTNVASKYEGDDCLLWPYGHGNNGRGLIRVDGLAMAPARYVCILVNGEPPSPHHDAAHECGRGTDGCISPRHLAWKTRSENLADRISHGTANRGERCGTAKLTEYDIRCILGLKGRASQEEIASAFGVHQSVISRICSRKSWGWLDVESNYASEMR
jgi:hypothetical protein